MDSFILRWWATSSADINLHQYTSSNSTFSCNNFASAEHFQYHKWYYGSMTLFKVSGIALNRMKNMLEHQVVTFY